MKRFISLLVVLSVLSAFAANPDQILKQSGESFHKAEFWSLEFQMLSYLPGHSDTMKVKGELKLGKNDRFRLNIPGQEFVSDGMTLWQYSVSQKQVMIKNVIDLQGGLHPSEALFRYLKCKPISVSDTVFEGVPVYKMQLDPAGQVKQFKSMTVWLKASDQIPVRLETTDKAGGIIVYKISNIRKNPALKESDFKFVIPKGVEELDMR